MTKTANIQQDTQSIPKGNTLSLSKGYKKTPLGIIPKEWEVKKLGTFGKFLKGKGVPKNKIIDKGYKCLTYGDIYTKYDNVIKDCRSFIDKEVAKTSQELTKGDLLFAGSGETLEDIGKCVAYIDDDKFFAGGDMIIFRPKQTVDSFTLAHILNSSKSNSQKHKMGQGHSVVHIYSSQLEKLKIALPPLPEQQKIAEILSTWDTAIEKQNALIEQLELRKRGLMQQLLTGKLRLRNAEGERFKGEWKKVRLGEVGDLMNGYAFKSETYKEGGRFKVITIANVQKGKLDLDDVNSIESIPLDIQEYQILKKGDMLISMTGNVGRICIVNEEYCLLNQRVGLIKVNDKKVLTKFLFYQISTNHFISEMQNKAQGGAQDNLGKYDILSYKLNIPSLSEQTAIAEVLSTADREIEIEKQKLTALQNQKKGLMQVLLSGRVRVRVKI